MKKTKVIHSYSGISTYENCPRQWHEQYVHRRWRTGTDATDRGVRIHAQLEAYLKGEDTPLDDAPPDGLLRVLRDAAFIPEMPLAVTAKWEPTDFWSDDARLRGKLDAVGVLGDTVFAVDWKTGKKRDNSLQARVYGAMLRAVYPNKKINIVFDYLSKGRTPPIPATREDQPQVQQLMDAMDDAEVFPPRPSGLCGWCAVETCEYRRERR